MNIKYNILTRKCLIILLGVSITSCGSSLEQKILDFADQEVKIQATKPENSSIETAEASLRELSLSSECLLKKLYSKKVARRKIAATLEAVGKKIDGLSAGQQAEVYKALRRKFCS